MPDKKFTSAIEYLRERATGHTLEHIRKMPLSEIRAEQMRRTGRPIQFVTHDEVERSLDKVLTGYISDERKQERRAKRRERLKKMKVFFCRMKFLGGRKA